MESLGIIIGGLFVLLAVLAWIIYQWARRGGVQHKADHQTVWDHAFHTYLTSISVTELDACPGIGPVTISKLRNAGYNNLAALQDAHIAIEGLGQKRLEDVTQAVQDLVKQARSRFDAGACREAQELEHKLQAARASRTEREPAKQSASAEPSDAAERRQLAGTRAAAAAPRFIPFAGTEPPVAHLAAPEVRADLFQEALQSAPPPLARLAETSAAEERDVTALQLTVEFAFAVARCDGRIAQKERNVIAEYLERRCGRDPILSKRAKAFCTQYEFSLIDPDACLQQIAVVFSAEERAAVLDLGYVIADASSGRNPRESMFLEKAARKLGLAPVSEPAPAQPTPEKAEPPKEKPSAPSREARLAALEIDPSTPVSADLIRRQYHLLSERYTPEKFESAGPDFVAVAQGKREAVVEAARALIEPFGEPLEDAARPAEPPELRHNPDLDAMFGD